MILYLALFLFFCFIGVCAAYDCHRDHPRILKPHNDRPFTSDELRQMGIVAPERYDCETFVRGSRG
jgi:hypothetical protein